MRVLIPIPSCDFDPTESAIPWSVLSDRGVEVVFATPDGTPGTADARMLSGRGLGPWRPLLRADARGRRAYAEMASSEAFGQPIDYGRIDAADFDGLVLPGGHAKGMKEYLESEPLFAAVRGFFAADKPVGAICHGVVVLARTTTHAGRSVLAGRRVTALTRSLELTGWWMTRLWLGDYYRTYPRTVEAEVREAVGTAGTFESGPPALLRDDPQHLDRGFTVVDGNLVTARWPGDAHAFAERFVREML